MGFIAAAMIAAGAILYAMGPDEPTHNGRPLSEWIERLGDPNDKPGQVRAEEAIRTIGAAAVPHLLRKLRARDSSLKEQIELIARLQPWFNVSFGRASAERAKAVRAFSALGPAAVGAVPELRRTLEEGENPKDVAETMSRIGSEAIVALQDALTSGDPNVRSAAIHGLDVSPHAPDDIAGEFLLMLNDGNAIVRFHAARAIFHHPQDPERAVPALTARLNDDSNLVRRYAARALGAYGSASREAREELQAIASDPEEDPRIVSAAQFALKKMQ